MSISSIGGASAPVAIDQPKSQNLPAEATKSASPTTAQAAEKASSEPITQASVKDAIKKINDFVGSSSDVEFSQDADTGIRIVKVVDRQTDTVIRQIPSEEVIQIAKSLDKLQGLLVRAKV